MTTIITAGFVSVDPGGTGVVVVSDDLELDAQFLNDAKTGVPFSPFGAERSVEFPGLIAASQMVARYVPPTDTSDAVYNDFILAYRDNLEITYVVRPTSAAVGVTNHQYTVKGFLINSPVSGIMHGEFVRYQVDIFVHEVEFDNSVIQIVW